MRRLHTVSHVVKKEKSGTMIVAPSLLSADFAHLASSVDIINRSHAQYVHCDVMDGVFVPNISFGFPVIKAVSRITDKPLDVHMMVVDPQKFVGAVRDSGAAIMNVHVEACTHLHRVVQAIRDAGMKPAVTLNPATPVVMLEDIIADVDMVLLMSVNPGFGGQKFIENTYNKIRRTRRLIEASGSRAVIEIDGGVGPANAQALADAGADVLVAGNAVFSATDPVDVINRMAAVQANSSHSI